jgi:predicted phosphodiesterase
MASEPKLPEPAAGTLITPPYLLWPGVGRMAIRFEVQGERVTKIVLRGPAGRERVVTPTLEEPHRLARHLEGRVYRADLADLLPCREYSYRLEPFEQGFPHRFTALPPGGEACPGGFRIVVFGDTRYGDEQHAAIMKQMQPYRPLFLLNVGDIINEARRLDEWRRFFDIERDVAGGAPMEVAPGNHEGYLDPPFGAAMMERYFGLPGRPGTGHRSFDVGPVHVVVLDLYWGTSMSERGRKWLEKDLSAVPDDRFRIVVMHEPGFSFSRHRVYSTIRNLRALFSRHRVDAVCGGHSHIYEHFLADKVHYLTLGGGGAPLHKPNMRVVAGEEKYQVSTGAFHHFMVVDIQEGKAVFRIIDSDSRTVHETFETVRPPPRQ